MYTKTCWILLGLLLLVNPSTKALYAQLAGDPEVYFEKYIRPLLVDHCYECHSVAAERNEGGLLLDSRNGWQVGGESGPAIVPGDAERSLIVHAVRYEGDIQMPPDEALTELQISRLEAWVKLGAPDPRIEEAAHRDYRNASDPVAGRQHWAFQPLGTSPPPTIEAQAWPLNPIDAFVYSELTENGLTPRPDAEPLVLLRRAYFQLTGMPPTQAQVKQFLADKADNRSDAFARLVDQLLASPEFGRRWGRHWLDLARYADSNGLDENFLFREAWRYRNWVIDAVNTDMAYDRFLLEQIAGDLLPYDDLEQRDRQRVATGFLVIGPKVLLGNDSQERKMDVADEQLDTIGRAVLGQTLGCARCHDHKFDPIPTSDYYALAGIFTSTKVMETRYMLGQQRLMEHLVGLGVDGESLDGKYEEYWRERPALMAKKERVSAALALLKDENEAGLTELIEKNADAICEVAADASKPNEARIAAQQEMLEELNRQITALPAIPPRAMISNDVEQPKDEAIRLAGQFDRHGSLVPRGFLQVLSNEPADIASGSSGRVELANWLTNCETGGGHLSARIMANRIWYHLMGRGIVRTLDNFGRTGETPSHPELLDYLAKRLIDSGWSMKALVREIVLSRSFAMSSSHDAAAYAIDPDNRLLWRANRRRLDPESLRDAMLLVAGELDSNSMDSAVWYLGDQATAVGKNENRRRTDFPCRSVFLPVIRNDLPELFNVFDFADPHSATGLRPQTIVATQGLFLLNDASVMSASEQTAKRLLDRHTSDSREGQEALANAMFELVLNAPATTEEINMLVDFVGELQSQLTAEAEGWHQFSAEAEQKEHHPWQVELRAWSIACQALLASSRFQILE